MEIKLLDRHLGNLLSVKRNDMRTVMRRILTYLIKHFHREPLSTLGALKRLLSVVETLIVLLQVTYAVEYFIAFVAPKLPRVILAVAAITALRARPHLVKPSFNGSQLVPREHGPKPVVFHARVGVGYVSEGMALRQVMLGLAHVVARAVEDRLVVGCVIGGCVVALVRLARSSVRALVAKVDVLPTVLGGGGGEGLECSGVTRVASTHVQILYFVTRVVRRTRAKR